MVEVLTPDYDALPDRGLAGYAKPAPVQPQRSWLDVPKDLALDTAAGIVDMGRAVGGIGDSVQTAFSAKPPASHPKMDAMADISSYLRDSRSESAKYLDENGGPSLFREPVTYAGRVATGIIPYAPLVPLGPWGALAAGALAYGTEHAEEREAARSADMSQNPKYQTLLRYGMSDQEARERLFQETSDPTNPDTYLRRGPAVVGNMLGMGVGASLTKAALRGKATDMASRIMNSVTGGSAIRQAGLGAASGAATGYLQGAGTDLSRQLGERQMGLRKDVDYGQVAEAGVEPGVLFGGLGLGAGYINRARQLRAERAGAEPIPEIGTDTLSVAAAEAENEGPDWNQTRWQPGQGGGPGESPPPPPGGGQGPGPNAPPPGRTVPGGGTFTPAPRPPSAPRGPGTFGPRRDYVDRPGGDLGEVPGVGPFGGDYGEPRQPRPPEEPPPPPGGGFPEIERPGLPGEGDFPYEAPVEGTRPFPIDPLADRRSGYPPAGTGVPGPIEGPAQFTPEVPPAGRGKRAIAEARRQGTFGGEEPGRGVSYAERVPLPGEDVPYDFSHMEPVRRVPEPGQREAEARAAEERQAASEVVSGVLRKADEHVPPVEPEGGPIQVEKPGRPKVEDFGEQPEATIPWRDRNAIEKALASKDATTRNQWANRLQRERDAGREVTLSSLPVLGQRMLRDIRDHIDRMAGDHPQGVIDAIRGRHTERIPDTEMSAEHKTALTALKNAATEDDLKYLNGTTLQLLKGGLKRVLWNRLPKTIRDIMDLLPVEQKRAIVDAYAKHAPEAVDYMHGIEHEKPPPQYRYKGDDEPGTRIEKLRAEIEARREAREAEKSDTSTAAAKKEPTIEETFALIEKVMPGLDVRDIRHPVQKTMEERVGLKQKSVGEQLSENIIEARWRTGTLAAALEPREREALEKLRDNLLRKPTTDPAEIMKRVSRAIRIANNRDAFYRTFTRLQREAMVREIREKERTADRRKVEEQARDKLVQKVLTDPELGMGRLADEFAQGKRSTDPEDRTTVRELFERLFKLEGVGDVASTFKDVPDSALLDAAARVLDLGRAKLETAAKAMQEMKFRKTSSQIGYSLPTMQRGVNQWYDRLAHLNTMVKAIERAIFTDSKGVTHLKPGKRQQLKFHMINMFVFDKLMDEPNGDKASLYESHVKEKVNLHYNRLQEHLTGLTTQLREYEGYEDLIASVYKRFPGNQKIVLEAEESARWHEAREKIRKNPHHPQNLRDERDKLAQVIAEMDTLSGIDPYAVVKEEGTLGSLEDRFIAALDDEKFVNSMSQHSIDFLIEHIINADEAALIQLAREKNRMNEPDRLLGQERVTRNQTPQDKSDVGRQALDEQKATKRAMEIGEELARLNEMLAEAPKTEKGAALVDKIEARLAKLEEEQRAVALDADPDMVNDDYAIRRLLDGSADLSVATNLPKGSYVRKVADFLRGTNTIPAKGLIGEKQVHNRNNIRPTDKSAASTMLNSLFDVAAKVVGDVDVVVVTPEQMRLLAGQRDLAVVPDRGFYDPKSHRIFVLREVMDPRNPDRAKILGHEITHPLIEVAVQRFPDIGRRLDAIRQMLKDEWFTPWSPTRELLGERANALDNVHEFLSDLFNDGGNVQRALRMVNPTEEQRAGLKTGKVRERLMRVARETGNLLTRALSAIRDGLFRLFLHTNRKNALSDAMVHSMDLLQGIEAMADRRGFMRPEFDPETMAPRPMPSREKEGRPLDEMLERLQDRVSVNKYEANRKYDLPRDVAKDVEPVIAAISRDNRSAILNAVHAFLHKHGEVEAEGGRSSQIAVLSRDMNTIREALVGTERDDATGTDIVYRDMKVLDSALPPEQRRMRDRDLSAALTEAAEDSGSLAFKKAAYLFGPIAKTAKLTEFTPQGWREMKSRTDSRADAFYVDELHRVFVPKDIDAGTLIHEVGHVATSHAIDAYPEFKNALHATIDHLTALPEYQKYLDAATSLDDEWMRRYAFEGRDRAHEFVAEFWANRDFRSFLREQKVPDSIRDQVADAPNLFKAVVRLINNFLNRLLGGKPDSPNFAEFTEKMIEDILEAQKGALKRGEVGPAGMKFERTKERPISPDDEPEKAHGILQGIGERAKHAWDRLDGGTGAALWGHDLAQLARRAEPLMQKSAEGVRLALAHSFTTGKRIMEESGANRIAAKIADSMRRNPKAWDKFQDYYDYENQSSVSGSDRIGEGRNAWIGSGVEHTQARKDHAILSAQYAQMPKPFRELRADLRAFFDTRHKDIGEASVMQLVELNRMAPDKVTRDALVKFIRDKESVTPAEKTLLQANVKGFSFDADRRNTTPEHAAFQSKVREIRAIGHLRDIPGVWYPKMRRGDWVVEGVFRLGKHAEKLGGVERERGSWDFESEAKRAAFIKAMADDPVLGKVRFLDKDEVALEDGSQRFRAKYNPLMLEFHDKHFDAHKQHAELKEAYGDDITMTHVEPRRAQESTYLNPVKADRALQAMIDSLRKSAGWQDLTPTIRGKLERDLNEAAIRHIMSTSARATYLPRRHALGARKDVMRDFLEYSTNTSYSLGELRHRNETRQAYRELDDYVGSMKDSGGPGDEQGKFGTLRRQIQHSLHRRIDYVPDPVFGPWYKRGLARILQFSYLDKLVSPANWLLNGTELIVSGAPMLAGVHGARAYPALIKAISDMGWMRYLDGFKDAAIAAKAGVGGLPNLPDTPARFKQATAHLPDAKAIHRMIDYLEEYGHLDRDSSMEMGRLFDVGASTALRTVDYVDNVTRQISAAIDNGNRVAMGIAALRMALGEGKGGGMTMEAALAHAEKYVHKTTGNYAKYNEAEMFRHPLLGPALQFKRYAQRMTANWLAAAYQAMWFADVSPEQRSVARHQLAYMAGTVVALSGVMGLPVEPIKGVINAFKPLTGFDSEDAEDRVRQAMAKGLGQDLGYALSRGIPRYFNVGIGTRLGMDSLWTQGAPGNRPDSWYAAFGHLLFGAPGGLVADVGEGSIKLASAAGNFIRGESNEGWNNLRHGTQLVLPFKVAADALDSTATLLGGPTTRARYGQPIGYQPTPGEAIMQTLGIQSGRKQERGDLNRAMSADKTALAEQRHQAFAMYVHAGSQQEKTAIWDGIRERYNKRWPEAPINRGDLYRAEERFRKEMTTRQQHPEYGGIALSRKQQELAGRHSAYVT